MQGAPAQLYTLTPKSSFAADLPTVAWQLVVEQPVAAAGLNTSRVALQRTPVSLDYFARAIVHSTVVPIAPAAPVILSPSSLPFIS